MNKCVLRLRIGLFNCSILQTQTHSFFPFSSLHCAMLQGWEEKNKYTSKSAYGFIYAILPLPRPNLATSKPRSGAQWEQKKSSILLSVITIVPNPQWKHCEIDANQKEKESDG